MFTAHSKIKKEAGKKADELEEQVAQALFDLEVNTTDLKADLKGLYITAAKEVDVASGKKAIVVFVPVKQLKQFRKVQGRLIREFEKKFSGKHVVFIGERKIAPPVSRRPQAGATRRPRKFTLTAVHNSILDDVVFPSEIVGRRLRVKLDSQVHKVFLDKKEQTAVEHKFDTFAAVYKKFTGKNVVFEFPASNE